MDAVLPKEDAYNTTFNMSIQELYDISKFLNVPESEWQNFIPMQLSQGSPAAMSWIITLVKSLKEKDGQIYQLKEQMAHIPLRIRNSEMCLTRLQ